MFLLGHCVWGYLFCRLTGRTIKTNIPISVALLAGILPDFDLIFGPIGLTHHTYTHSLIILGPLTILLIAVFRNRGLIISVGILSHLLTDGLVGTLPIFYPLSLTEVGLGIGSPSRIDAILEVGFLFIILLYMLKNGDARSILKGASKNIWVLIPLVSIIALSLLFAQDNNIYLPAFAFSRKALTVITMGHYLLGAVMSIAVFQGLRYQWNQSRKLKKIPN